VQTQFFIASVSKSFTATAIMQLVKENGTPVLEHNGILSTFYTDVVLLPQDKYGIVLLYNISAMPLIAIALPQIKTALETGKAWSSTVAIAVKPEMIWLSVCPFLGVINGTLRLSDLIQYARE
jgi:hypothetical protein